MNCVSLSTSVGSMRYTTGDSPVAEDPDGARQQARGTGILHRDDAASAVDCEPLARSPAG